VSSDLSGSDDEEGAAVLEEREALNLQKKMAAELDDMDFGLDIFKVWLSLWDWCCTLNVILVWFHVDDVVNVDILLHTEKRKSQ
jgi:hypothetical protein